MNGVHDMGGMDGFGKVTPEPNEPVFHAEWEARVLALVRAMGAAGAFNIDTSRFYREALPPHVYLSSSYYKKWLLGLESLLVDKGFVRRTEDGADRRVRRLALTEEARAMVLELDALNTSMIGRLLPLLDDEEVRVLVAAHRAILRALDVDRAGAVDGLRAGLDRRRAQVVVELGAGDRRAPVRQAAARPRQQQGLAETVRPQSLVDGVGPQPVLQPEPPELFDGARGEPVALRAEQERDPLRRPVPAEGVGQVHRARVGGERQQPEPGLAHPGQAVRPLGEPRVRQGEHRTHRHLDRTPVERVGAVR